MGFFEIAGKIIGAGIGLLLDTGNSAQNNRDKYNSKDMSKEEMEKALKRSTDLGERSGIIASMKDKGYRE